jgi:hypothetical protein
MPKILLPVWVFPSDLCAFWAQQKNENLSPPDRQRPLMPRRPVAALWERFLCCLIQQITYRFWIAGSLSLCCFSQTLKSA